MWKILKHTVAIGSVAVALSNAPAFAQETGPADTNMDMDAPVTTTTPADEEEGFNLGWLG